MALKIFPMSNTTTCQYIYDLAENVQEQLMEQVKKCEYFALQLDESTDIAKMDQLLCHMRFFRHGAIV